MWCSPPSLSLSLACTHTHTHTHTHTRAHAHTNTHNHARTCNASSMAVSLAEGVEPKSSIRGLSFEMSGPVGAAGAPGFAGVAAPFLAEGGLAAEAAGVAGTAGEALPWVTGAESTSILSLRAERTALPDW